MMRGEQVGVACQMAAVCVRRRDATTKTSRQDDLVGGNSGVLFCRTPRTPKKKKPRLLLKVSTPSHAPARPSQWQAAVFEVGHRRAARKKEGRNHAGPSHYFDSLRKTSQTPMAAITNAATELHSSGESFQPAAAASVASPAQVDFSRSFPSAVLSKFMPSPGCQSLPIRHSRTPNL